ncbi:MAG: isopentenyl-diphosphate Delta-isomerase [Candidatus Saccharimonadales bacterium]
MQTVHSVEQIVFVNADGTPTGEVGPKLASHTADTRLHLAFSCYVFNDRGEFLVTQRAHVKKVWPDVWTNSVCGHPAPGEDMVAAIKRRLAYELGMEATDFQIVLPRYRYTTPPYNGIIENEFCPVFVARASSVVLPNPEEVDDCKWLSWDDFVREAEADVSDIWSWWCKDQLKQLKNNAVIAQYVEAR